MSRGSVLLGGAPALPALGCPALAGAEPAIPAPPPEVAPLVPLPLPPLLIWPAKDPTPLPPAIPFAAPPDCPQPGAITQLAAMTARSAIALRRRMIEYEWK